MDSELLKKEYNEATVWLWRWNSRKVQKGINWNDCKTVEKRGSVVIKVMGPITGRSKWAVDTEMPIIFQNKDYLENILKNIGKTE